MRHFLSLLMAVVAAVTAGRAQTEAEQLLVFRTTGEVNLFYTSEIDSIVSSRVDRDSVIHDNIVTQVFYTTDTTMVVPIAEIDSVALGSRNVTEMKDGVRMMTEEDSLWIVRYDGRNIYYRHDTPPAILPREGEKLFYGCMDRLFPIGLVARVTSIAFRDDEYVVGVTDIELADVFDRLFFAGAINVPVKQSAVGQPRRAQLEMNETLEMSIDIGDNINVGCTDAFSISGTVVADVLRGYYSMEADVRNELDLGIKAGISESDAIEEEVHIGGIPLGVYAMVFTPSIEFDGFVEVNAELMANLHTRQKAGVHVSYKKLPRQEPQASLTPLKGEDNGVETQADITCKGELYMGIRATLGLNILRETAGARVKFKIGPSLQSEFGLGLLEQSAADYNPEVYAKAELNTSLKMAAEVSLYRRDHILWGEENEHDLLKYEHKFFETTYDLFPHFFQTRAVAVETADEDIVTMATKSENEILSEVETGFELLDTSGEPVDSIFVGTVEADTTAVQAFCGDIDISGLPVAETKKKKLAVRPVFHYARRTIKAQVAPLMSDMQLQPMVFGGTNGVVTYLSGLPFSGSAVGGGTLYTAGPYLPVTVRDTVFVKPGPVDAGLYLDDYRQSLLVGTWSGVEGKTEVAYTFRADGTCSMYDASAVTPGTYVVNDPQSGRISLYPDDEAKGGVKVMSVINVSETVLQYRTPGDAALHTLSRQ